MSVLPPDDLDYIDLDDLDRYAGRPAGTRRQPRQPRRTPQPSTSWTDPRFFIPLLLFLTAVLLIGLAIRSGGSDGGDSELLDLEGQVLSQSELAERVQQAELRAGFGGLTVSEENDTIIITGTAADAATAASIGAVARSVEGTQRVDNRVIVTGGAIDSVTPATTTTIAVATGAGGLSDQLAQAGAVTFETGSTAITAEGSATLDGVAALLNRAPGVPVEIHGHTDNEGDETSNQLLSQQRAESVIAALAQRGVDTTRLSAIGFGSSNPIAPNITEDGRAINRRIEFILS